MAVVNNKDIPDKRSSLGQFFTPPEIAKLCLSHTKIETNLVIEPSCGQGVFLDLIDKNVIAIEIDETLAKPNIKTMNFYDFNSKIDEDVTFIGNPPFRTPALSLSSDKVYNRKIILGKLCEKYGITGIREEAAFFLIKSIDLILTNKVKGHIYYILPKTIFHNNSKAYKTFFAFLQKYVRMESVVDLPKGFDGVTVDLCWVHLSVGYSKPNKSRFYGVNEKMITFHEIFKKTYLGSVPCESVLLSVRGEPLEHFSTRLYKLISSDIKTEEQLLEGLSYEGNVHLVGLRKRNPNKIKVVWDNVDEIKRIVAVDEFLNMENYKPIRHRKEDRWYFRYDPLKKAKFVYQLNPNPCPSFYFPGNPAKGCLDYYGFCDYDINRNCSPSANRCVPVDGIEDNLTDEFKDYWDKNTGLDYFNVFYYLWYVLDSDWYKEMKSKYQRFYFGIPKDFDKSFLEHMLGIVSLNFNRSLLERVIDEPSLLARNGCFQVD